MTLLPCVIMEANPDWKRPYVSSDFNTVNEDDIVPFFLSRICEFILDRMNIGQITSEVDIHSFFEEYYDECYMDNPVWKGMVFRDGEWHDATPSFESIWEQIQQEKAYTTDNHSDNDSILDDDTSNNHTSDAQTPLQTMSDVNHIMGLMKQCFEESLKERQSSLDQMSSMDNTDQIMCMLSQLSTITSQQFNKHNDVCEQFLSICVRLVEAEINMLSQQLHEHHDDATMKRLQDIIGIKTALVTYKTQLGF